MKKRAIALGTFDGVHRGHMRLMRRMLEIAEENSLEPLIYTFSNHPMEAFDRAPKRIMKDGERIAALSGIARVEAQRFTRELAAMPPEEFARYLVEELGAAAAIAGFNYTFGRGGEGGIEQLRMYGERLGFEVCEIPPLMYEGEAISSTRIRRCLEDGGIQEANAMLGREFSLSGVIVSNKRIGGSVLGIPTANIPLDERTVCPKKGVYAARAMLDGHTYPAVTNIGKNPTVGGDRVTFETHIIGFEGDIYGRELSVSFVERLRGDVTFNSLEELSAQIRSDIQKATEILGK